MLNLYSFQQAREGDKAVIYTLYATVMKDYITEIWGWNSEWQENDFNKHFIPCNITLVKEKKRVIGYSQIEEQESRIYLRMLLLLPEYQRQGIGSYLLKAVIEKAQRQSKAIALQVFKLNDKAIKFYWHHGFQVQGETEESFIMELLPHGTN